MCGGFLADAKGRKFPILGFAALQGLAMFLSGFATGPAGLYVLMFASGLGMGGYFSSGMALLTELADDRRRGLMISLAILFAPIGLSLCSLLAGHVAPLYGWSWVFFIGGLLCIPLLLALLFLVPESPKYLARFPHRAEAHRKVVARLGLAPSDEQPAAEEKGKGGLSLVGTLLRERLAASLGLWLLFFVMYVLGSIVLSWTPVVFSSVGFDVGFASRTLFFWTIGSLVGTLLAGWCMGRMSALATATLFSAASVVVIAVLTFMKIEPAAGRLVIVLLPAAGFSVAGVVTTLYTLAAEIYPTAMRATGIGIADAIGRVGGIVSAFAGIYVLDRAGAFGFFLSILCLAGVTLAILLFFQGNKARFAAA